MEGKIDTERFKASPELLQRIPADKTLVGKQSCDKLNSDK